MTTDPTSGAGTATLTRHAPVLPVDPTGLDAARHATFARLDVVDAAPAPRRTARPALRWGLAAASAAALTVAGLTLPSPGDPAAFAGWRAVPAPVDAQTLAADGAACADLGGPLPGTPDAAAAHPVLSERRGPYAFTVVSSDGWLRYCLVAPTFAFANVHSPDGSTSSGVSGSPATQGESWEVVDTGGFADPAPGTLTLATAGTFTSDGEQWSTALGRVAPDVTSVQVSLSDGTTVDATAAEGVYAAWWPGTAQPREVVGVATDGSRARAALDVDWSVVGPPAGS